MQVAEEDLELISKQREFEVSVIHSQALREAAEQAMPDNWGFDADLFHELVTID